jgi:preprotein translocase subunit SecF
MTITITIELEEQTVAIYVVNSLFLSGLILDIAAAFLAFLTSRWLQRLENSEKAHLEDVLGGNHHPRAATSQVRKFLHNWFSLSLFVAMPLLVIAVMFMVVGIMVYVWSAQHLSVAVATSIALALPLPFIVGVFCIGRDQTRRENIINHLGGMRGDW